MKRLIAMGVAAIALLVAAVAGFIIVPEHAPVIGGSSSVDPFGNLKQSLSDSSAPTPPGPPWSQTLYDVARIGTWAALIIGVLLAATTLIVLARRSP